MQNMRTVGMVIYTYSTLEQRFKELWEWVEAIERWSGKSFTTYYFTPEAKRTSKAKSLTLKERERLSERLQLETPWYAWGIAWPTIEKRLYLVGGIQITIRSRPQPERGQESYRSPSYIFLEAHVDLMESSLTQAASLVSLGTQLWRIVDGVYGFIDVETGVPLQDDLLRNSIHLFDSTVPPEFHAEFREWQKLMPVLNRRVWKAFWGNFLGAEHLEIMGGVKDLQRADPQRRMLPEYKEQAYRIGRQKLEACDCFKRFEPLSGGGVVGCLSESPLDWFEPEVQTRTSRLQATLGDLAIEL